MKISVIIPVYNVEPYLRECLDSVLGQTFTDWEAVCVDDGSRDGSSAILDEYAARDSRFQVIHQSNKGLSAARNAGMDAAKGEWLFFLDSDDVIVLDAFERLNAVAAGDRYDAVITGALINFTNEAPTRSKGNGSIYASCEEKRCGAFLLRQDKPLWGYAVLRFLRRELFGCVYFPLLPMEDSLSLIHVLAVEARWCWVNISVYGYRQTDVSLSHGLTVQQVKRLIPCFTRMYEDSLTLLHLSRSDANALMRQYKGSMSYYLNSVVDAASLPDLQEIARLYYEHKRAVGIHTANLFNRIRLWQVMHLGTKTGFSLLRKLEHWTNRIRGIVHGWFRGK